MNNLTNKNIKSVYAQNYEHYLKLHNKVKRFKPSVRENVKYKVFYEAQLQLQFSKPLCYLSSINEDDVKLSDLETLYKKKVSKDLIQNNEIISVQNNQNTSQKSDNSSVTKIDLNQENSEILESSSTSSGYSSLNVLPFCSSQENLNSNHYANNENKDIENNENRDVEKNKKIDEDKDDDFIQIVNAVQLESQCDVKNEKSGKELITQLENNNGNTVESESNIRRTNRVRKPVLYSEDLAHIQFIRSPKRHCSTSNSLKHSLSASTTSSSGSRKKRKICNETTNQLTSPTSSRNNNTGDNTTEINNIIEINKATDMQNYVQIKSLPKGSKGSYLELAVGASFARHISKVPVRVIVGLMETFQQENEAIDDKETAAAVASINFSNTLNSFNNPDINRVEPIKRIRKPRNNKNSKVLAQPKSDLAKYIETFEEGNILGDSSNITTNCNNNNNNNNPRLQQIPYQSPQNTGITTTTGEYAPTATIELSNAEWRTIPDLPSTSTFTFNELYGNQFEGDLNDENNFNIIKFIDSDNSALTTNTVPENNNVTDITLTNTTAPNIVLKRSSPTDITSTTTTTSPTTNQYTLNRTLREDTYYNTNNIFLHQPTPIAPPQPFIKNHFERASLANHVQLLSSPPPTIGINNQYKVIYKPLPSAHQSSIIYNQPNQFCDSMNILDLSTKHTIIDLQGRRAKEELIINNTTNNNQGSKNIISLEDYKNRHANKILTTTNIAVRGRDMPSLVEDEIININNKNTSTLIKDNNIDLNSTTNLNNKMSISSSSNLKKSEINDNEQLIEIVDSQIIKIPENQPRDDKNLPVCTIEMLCENNKEELVNLSNNIDITNNSNSNSELKSVKETELKINGNKTSIEDVNQKTETKNNCRKSIDAINFIDEFLSMKNNEDLDYEQEVDLDCLIINSSPTFMFDNDDDGPTIIQSPPKKIELSNGYQSPPKKIELINEKDERQNVDIFGILHTNLPDKENPIKETTVTTTCNNNSEKSLKEFKIPKIYIKPLENSSSSTKITNATLNRTSVLNFNEENSEKPPVLRCWPNNPTNILKLPITQNNVEVNSRITVQSNSFPTTSIPTTELLNISYHSDNRGRNIGNIAHVFGSPCYSWLKSNCTKEKCRYKHHLIDETIVKTNLLELNVQYVEKAYFESTKYFKLFNKYFIMFCQLFKNNVEMLTKILNDCQKFAKHTDFLIPFRDGLNQVGWSNIDAVNLILNNWSDYSTNSINSLIELIIDTDAIAFLSILEHYSKLQNYRYQIESINKLAAIYNKYKNYDLMQILLTIVPSITTEEFLEEKNEKQELIKFLELLKNLNIHTEFSKQNNIPHIVCSTSVTTPSVLISPQLIQRTIKQDNLTVLLNQQLQPGHQNLFMNTMQ